MTESLSFVRVRFSCSCCCDFYVNNIKTTTFTYGKLRWGSRCFHWIMLKTGVYFIVYFISMGLHVTFCFVLFFYSIFIILNLNKYLIRSLDNKCKPFFKTPATNLKQKLYRFELTYLYVIYIHTTSLSYKKVSRRRRRWCPDNMLLIQLLIRSGSIIKDCRRLRWRRCWP